MAVKIPYSRAKSLIETYTEILQTYISMSAHKPKKKIHRTTDQARPTTRGSLLDTSRPG